MNRKLNFLLIFTLFVLFFLFCKEKVHSKLDLHNLKFEELFTYSLAVNDSILLDSVTDIIVDTIMKFEGDYYLTVIESVDSLRNDIKMNFIINSFSIHEKCPSVRKRNIYEIEVLGKNSIIADNLITERIDTFNKVLNTFFTNPDNNTDLPEKKFVEINSNENVEISKGLIVIYCNTDSNSFVMKERIDELRKLTVVLLNSFKDIRNQASLNKWDKSFKELDLDKKVYIAKSFPLSFSIAFYKKNKFLPFPIYNLSFN